MGYLSEQRPVEWRASFTEHVQSKSLCAVIWERHVHVPPHMSSTSGPPDSGLRMETGVLRTEREGA